MNNSTEKSGLLASLQHLLATALEMVQVRLDLLGTEVEFEKRRLFDGLIWGAVALLALGIGAVLFCGFIILMFAPEYRLAAVGVMALLFLGGAALLMRQARARLRTTTGMFDATLAELKQDQNVMRASSQDEQ
jgi:uncharacterized membrane protein YqjE